MLVEQFGWVWPGWLETLLGIVASLAMPLGLGVAILKYPPADRSREEQDLALGSGGDVTGVAEVTETPAPLAMHS